MDNRLNYLLERYVSASETAEERTELLQSIYATDQEPVVKEWMKQHWKQLAQGQVLSSEVSTKLFNFITAVEDKSGEVKVMHRTHIFKTTWFRYAAAILIICGIGAYLYTTQQQQTLVKDNTQLQSDIAPGHDRAILTLANGQQIILDSTQGNIVKQGNLTVVNLAGKLKYDGVGTNAEYNTISTPKGGQYQIVLPDGSKVWLNAASSIKFPTAFTSNERKVEMTGEAYMEIAKNSKQSFVVTTSGAEIQVLGTSFNVNAYEDESAVKTTLIEGSVKVISGMNSSVSNKSNQTGSSVVVSSDQQSKAVILKPGQQAVVSSSQQLKVVNNADIKQALAWKNGAFRFNKANLADALRELARWYDIEVVYEKGIPDIKLEGGIKRDLTLTQMLDALSELGVKFRMEGKRLIIQQ